MQGDEMAAGVEHGDGQGLQSELPAFRESGADEDIGLFERDLTHANLPSRNSFV